MGFIAEASASILGRLCVRLRALEDFLELLQHPSCKVVLGIALLLGGGGLVLWSQWRKKKAGLEGTGDKSPESIRANNSWIKSHFSRLSEERLPTYRCVNASAHQPARPGENSTTIHKETLTSTHGEGGVTLRRDSFASKQKVSGASVIKETQRESEKSSCMEDETWAAVAACTKEIDAKGRHVANSILQRSSAYQNAGHLESRDVTPEDLKALEEVEIKLKRNFLSHRETTIAGANQTHTIYGQSRHGHQNRQSHQIHQGYQSNQNHTVHSSHQGHHPGHVNHQAFPSHSSHQSHVGHTNHQGHPAHSSHQSHVGHANHQGHPAHSSHQSHQGQPGHPSHQSHSLPNRSHQIYDS
ncbi:uncharacterized protein C10orf62 homolog [Meriones unguiculatus]|uniref:uncharacterized protein C10orf62 homolog n=1 Tax=Meriones unguiculatus TaxID=10047 RepID=UPI000B4ED48D|nr:uncharacterized protein C10orf62 homolog [Meriones unguiculatus]